MAVDARGDEASALLDDIEKAHRHRRPPEATKGARSVLDDIDVGIWNFMNVLFFFGVFLNILVLAMY